MTTTIEAQLEQLADELNTTIGRVEELLRAFNCKVPVLAPIDSLTSIAWRRNEYNGQWCLWFGPNSGLRLRSDCSLAERVQIAKHLPTLVAKARTINVDLLNDLRGAIFDLKSFATTLEEEV